MLATPTQCGTYPVESDVRPRGTRASAPQTSTQYFTLDSGPERRALPRAPRPFEPGVRRGLRRQHRRGAHRPSRWSSARDDGDQNLAGLDGHHSARASLRRCAASPTARSRRSRSSASSALLGPGGARRPRAARPPRQIGTAIAGAGAGSRPLYVPGKAYLAGPYKGAPLSLVVVTPGRLGAL